MVSEKQLIANRINAKKGGVKTKKGKAKIKYNAIKHGALSLAALLPGENSEGLSMLTNAIWSDLKPVGAMEKILTDRIISSYWRLRRLMKFDSSYWKSVSPKPSAAEEEGDRIWIMEKCFESTDIFLKISRYETTIERQLYKALHELTRLQMARLGQAPPAPIAIDVDTSS